MVTLAEIDAVHEQLGHVESLADYARALADLGIRGYASFVVDGHTEFATADDVLQGPPHHAPFEVAATPDHEAVHEVLRRAAANELDYVAMSKALAAAGLDRWTVDTGTLTMTYTDVAGDTVLVEQLDAH